MFTNTLPLSADAIAHLPASVRVGATSSVGMTISTWRRRSHAACS